MFSVGVDEESGEGAVFVCVPTVDLPSVQLHAHLIAHVQVQDHTVGGIVVVLISVLSNGAGSYLSPTEDRGTHGYNIDQTPALSLSLRRTFQEA